MTSWCIRGALQIAFIDISILEWQEQAKLYLKASGNTILKRSVTIGKKKCQHILFTPPQHRSKIPVWIISNANTQPHKTLRFLKCFSKHKCVFSIKNIQLHERKSWLLSVHSIQNKCQLSHYSWKKVRGSNALLGEQKTSVFPIVYPKPIDNIREWSQGSKGRALPLPFYVMGQRDNDLWASFCMESNSSLHNVKPLWVRTLIL